MEESRVRLQQKIKDLKERGLIIINNGEGDDDIYEFNSPYFGLKVVLNSNWIGLEFELLDENGTLLLSYEVDTDQYDLSKAENHKFAEETEAEILKFLDDLVESKIMAGAVEGSPAIVIPVDGNYLLIRSGKRMSKSEHFENKEQALNKGSFTPLRAV
jgi:hypothetical protein